MRFLFTKDPEGEGGEPQEDILSPTRELLGESALLGFSQRLEARQQVLPASVPPLPQSEPAAAANLSPFSSRPARVRRIESPREPQPQEAQPVHWDRKVAPKSCLYCGAPLPIMARCLDRTFCNAEHARRYEVETQQRLLERLQESDSNPRAAGQARVPIQSVNVRHRGSRRVAPVRAIRSEDTVAWPDWLLRDCGGLDTWRWDLLPASVIPEFDQTARHIQSLVPFPTRPAAAPRPGLEVVAGSWLDDGSERVSGAQLPAANGTDSLLSAACRYVPEFQPVAQTRAMSLPAFPAVATNFVWPVLPAGAESPLTLPELAPARISSLSVAGSFLIVVKPVSGMPSLLVGAPADWAYAFTPPHVHPGRYTDEWATPPLARSSCLGLSAKAVSHRMESGLTAPWPCWKVEATVPTPAVLSPYSTSRQPGRRTKPHRFAPLDDAYAAPVLSALPFCAPVDGQWVGARVPAPVVPRLLDPASRRSRRRRQFKPWPLCVAGVPLEVSLDRPSSSCVVGEPLPPRPLVPRPSQSSRMAPPLAEDGFVPTGFYGEPERPFWDAAPGRYCQPETQLAKAVRPPFPTRTISVPSASRIPAVLSLRPARPEVVLAPFAGAWCDRVPASSRLRTDGFPPSSRLLSARFRPLAARRAVRLMKPVAPAVFWTYMGLQPHVIDAGRWRLHEVSLGRQSVPASLLCRPQSAARCEWTGEVPFALPPALTPGPASWSPEHRRLQLPSPRMPQGLAGAFAAAQSAHSPALAAHHAPLWPVEGAPLACAVELASVARSAARFPVMNNYTSPQTASCRRLHEVKLQLAPVARLRVPGLRTVVAWARPA